MTARDDSGMWIYEGAMSRKIIIVLSLLAVFLLAYFCIKINSPAIEDDLVARSEAALASEGIVSANVSTDGRELRLTGVVPTEEFRAQAGDTVRGVWGVRTVDNQLTVESMAATDVENYDLVVVYDGVSVLLEGYVPDEVTRSDIVKAAQSHLDTLNVIDKLSVLSGAPAGWGDLVKQAAIAHMGDYTDMTARFHNTELSISGHVASEDLHDQLQHYFSQSLKTPYSLTAFNVKVKPDAIHVAALDCQKLFNDLLSDQKIYFEVSRARIKSESDALISQLADVALKCPDTKIEIAGHTDSSGPRAMNQKLSEMRASAVVQRLVAENISADRLIAVGYGEMRPIADNKTDEGRSKNRRIEFNILGD